MKNYLKKKLQKGLPVIGTWMQIPNGDIAEIISRVGFDFCICDLEHSEISNNNCVEIFRALGDKCVPGVRVSSNELLKIRKPLDLGAKIIIVPLVNNKEEAINAVKYAKYPNSGVRGFAFCRANNWGMDFNGYVQTANDDNLVFVMIESVEAINNIDDILSVEGLDGVVIGPYDLSGSFGFPGKTHCSQVEESIKKVVESCKKHNKIAGQHIVNPSLEDINKALKDGYLFIPVGIDALFLYQSMNKIVGALKENL